MSNVPKILIVDDDPRMCSSLKVLLGNEGYEIETTLNGQEALEALGTDDFDVVLLDLVLPDITATEIMDHIARQTPETYAIIITGYASWESAVESLKKGVFDYLRKPFDHGELSRTIKNALDQKALKSERKQVEEALRKSEERFRSFLDNLGDVAYEVDANGVVTYGNKMAEKMTGLSLQDLLGRHFVLLFTEESQKLAADAFEQTLNGESAEYELTLTNGTIGHFRSEPLRDENRKIVGLFGIARDITEDKQVQEALRESREKYRILIEKSPLGVSMIEDDGRYKYINPKFVEMFGYTLDDIPTGREWFEKAFPDPEARNQAISTWTGDLKNSKIGEVRGRTFTATCKDGSEKVIYFRPVTLETGKQFVIYEDVTERKRIQEELQQAHDELERRVEERTAQLVTANEHLQLEMEERKQAQDKYKTLVENSLTGIFIHQDGKYVFVNDRFAEMHGYEPEALVGMEHSILMHPDEREALFQIAQKRLEGAPVSPQYEARRLRKDGTTIWCKMMATCIEYSGRPAIMGNIVDITKRKQALAAVRQRDETLSGIISSMTDHMTLIDNELNIVWANSFAKQSLGTDLVGKKCYSVYRGRGEACGSCVVRKCFEDGMVHEHETEVIGLAGNRMIFWHTGSVAAWHSDGRPKLAVLVGRNITERKRAEEALRNRKEALKAQAHRLEEVNTALRVLLKRREEDKFELEEKVLANVKELVLPYVEALRKTRLGAKQLAYTSIIESHLKDIVSPFLRSLSSKYLGLTPREIQVAGLVKQGKTNKEIAELLSVSVRAVEFHRESIRTKLGLKHQPVNLRSFLLSFQ